ncbi:MAG TPA: hypothetical protein VGM06_10490 [Polyangiaceae bacterium]|jgi:hypothetical protein
MANAVHESPIADLQSPVASSVKELGVTETARRLDLDPTTVLRLAAGISPRRGSIAVARANLHKLHA